MNDRSPENHVSSSPEELPHGEGKKPGIPERLRRWLSFDGPPSIFVGSAEGITTFGGLAADPNAARTRAWLDAEFAKIGAAHPAPNAGLEYLRSQQDQQETNLS